MQRLCGLDAEFCNFVARWPKSWIVSVLVHYHPEPVDTMSMRDFSHSVYRVALTVMTLSAATAGVNQLHGQEALPPAQTRRPCPTDRALASLTVDITPLDENTSPVADVSLPEGCEPGYTADPVPFFVTYGPESWNCHNLLQFARFCHPRLYFEDAMLERYGMEPVFPCVHSTAQFTCDLFLLPARLLVNKRCPCVRTPTPHCWSGCSVCGF